MGKTMLSFVLRVLMISLGLLGGMQLLALLAGTSTFLQAVLVAGTSGVLTYKMAVIDSRLTRARNRRKTHLRVA